MTRAAALGAFASLLGGCSTLHALRHHENCSAGTLLNPPDAIIPIVEGRIATRQTPPIRYALALPQGVDRRSITRVVYLLPGRGGSARDTLHGLGFAAAQQRLVRDGAPPFAVLSVDAGESYFHPRTSGEDRLAIVERTLPQIARAHLAPHLTYEAVAGMSMGGYGALLAAERHPQRYGAVAVAGPALFRSFSEEDHAIGDGFDNAAQFAEYDVYARAQRLATMPVMIRIGHGDPFYANVRALSAMLPHADVRFIEHGCHDDGFWRATSADLLAFASSGGRR